MASTPGPCTGSPAAPAASAQRAPATGRPQLHLSAQAGRLVKENTTSQEGAQLHARPCAKCTMGTASYLLTMALPGMLTPSQQWKFREEKGTA